MSLPRRAILYFHTLRYLKPIQIWARLLSRFQRPRPDTREAPPLRVRIGNWQQIPNHSPSMTGPARFRFLNQEGELPFAGDWNASAAERLWLYNLHYFDDLNAYAAKDRKAWHRALLARWISQNPPGFGVGWEPYPLSLRIVNWVKWELGGNTLDDKARHSLAIQARYLRRRLEYHILGNHLLANIKALIFAGLYFDGEEADEWLDTGLAVLRRQLPEQILPDGGHFERSPMYHSVVLEDLLDLVNVLGTYGRDVPSLLSDAVPRMMAWAEAMIHPDGDISFFNDATLGVAAAYSQLRSYAERLRFVTTPRKAGPVILPNSGYARLERTPYTAVVDVAPIGPDYLPGHAHADTLSFELSADNCRILVNSGTSLYEQCEERLRQRGTAAHNTVRVDGMDSSEVWGSFRVARRARVQDVVFDPKRQSVSAWHDGYSRLPGHPVHRREVVLDDEGLMVVDEIIGKGVHRIEGFLLFHPDVVLEPHPESDGYFLIELPSAHTHARHRLIATGMDRTRIDGEALWHPEFGRSVSARRLVFECVGSLPLRMCTLISPLRDSSK